MPHIRTSGLAAKALPLLALLGLSPPAGAQWQRQPVDPDMPVKEGFDEHRAIFWTAPNFIPLRNPEWKPLRDARRAGEVEDGTTVVAFRVGEQIHVLVSSQMSYHHVAQGEIAGEPWMVTF